MVDLSYETLAGVFLFMAFISPVVAGYMYGQYGERMDSDPLGVLEERDNDE